MDALLYDLKIVAEQMIPILVVIVLIILAIALFRLGKLFSSGIDTLTSLKGSIRLVEKSLDKAQAPLDTLVKLSHTVDGAHESAVNLVADTKAAFRKSKNDTQS